MNQKFLEDVMKQDVTDDLLDESYHVNFDVTVDSDKFKVKVTAKNTENGQYILYGLNNIVVAVLREIGDRYEMPTSELMSFLSDSVAAIGEKEMNTKDYIGLEFKNE